VNATDIRLRAVERLGPERVESVVLDRERREVLPPGRFESEPVRIAKGSVLDVGLGVRGEASATFQVQLCAERSCERLLSHTPKRANAWTDRSIELEADRQGRLVFEVDSEHGVWSTPRLSARERETGDHDLLLISIDTLRADHLGAYGYARNTSPVIDAELAAKGTLFEWAISTATTTGPSHMSMLTGLAPTVHGTHGFLAGLPDGVPTLASVLREQGYATAAVTENGPMAAERGFDRGFDGYIENKSADLKAHAGHVEDTLSRGLAWIRAHRDRRRFLFLHTFQVHTPYAPPPRYQNLFASDDVDPRGMSFLPPWWQPRRYDQEIRYTDTEFGAFLGALEEDGLLDDTIVVLVSDHGEEHLDHRALGHGPAVHDKIL
jgi:arylsulfatase A-like enzyme